MLSRRRTQVDEPTRRKPLRLWPGVVAVLLQWLIRFVVPAVILEATAFAMIGGVLGGLVIVVWWAFFSRARWTERGGAVVLVIVGLAATSQFIHVSISAGAMGYLFPIYAIPVLSLAFVVWAVATRRMPDGLRRASMVVTILLACGGWTLLRTAGISGDFRSAFHWRWTKTPEERLLAQAGDEPVAPPSVPAASQATADWPGFRGPGRDGIVRGVRIETDWSTSPPVELWRRPIGPAWSSFAVRGNLLYTQEQRGDHEIVAAYSISTGEPVWRHSDAVRFWESNSGPGPRGTPTVSNGRVYTFGATGLLNALDADDGAVMWSRDVATDASVKVPGWGFSSSPLVVDDTVIVAISGALVAYDLATGNPRWFGPAGRWSYSSPHRLTIDGVAQIVLLNGAGVSGVALADGTLLWDHSWEWCSILQPALTADGDVLIAAVDMSPNGIGMRRIAVRHGPGGWTVEERWTSRGLKPCFNDFVVHEGYAFGFDGRILSCIELQGGKRKWKGGRYGHGQLVLLSDQSLLLVLSEQGELALVSAVPDKFTEVARFPAIEGKTWNHPVLVGDVLLVRNDEEMAAFRLSLAGR